MFNLIVCLSTFAAIVLLPGLLWIFLEKEHTYKDYPQMDFDSFYDLYQIAPKHWLWFDEYKICSWDFKRTRHLNWMLSNPLIIQYDDQKFIIKRKDKLKALFYLRLKKRQERIIRDTKEMTKLNKSLSTVYKSMQDDINKYRIKSAQETVEKIEEIVVERLKSCDKLPIKNTYRYKAVIDSDENKLYLYDNLKELPQEYKIELK